MGGRAGQRSVDKYTLNNYDGVFYSGFLICFIEPFTFYHCGNILLLIDNSNWRVSDPAKLTLYPVLVSCIRTYYYSPRGEFQYEVLVIAREFYQYEYVNPANYHLLFIPANHIEC